MVCGSQYFLRTGRSPIKKRGDAVKGEARGGVSPGLHGAGAKRRRRKIGDTACVAERSEGTLDGVGAASPDLENTSSVVAPATSER